MCFDGGRERQTRGDIGDGMHALRENRIYGECWKELSAAFQSESLIYLLFISRQ